MNKHSHTPYVFVETKKNAYHRHTYGFMYTRHMSWLHAYVTCHGLGLWYLPDHGLFPNKYHDKLFHMHFIASQKKATSNTFHFLNASKSYILDICHQKGKIFESFNLWLEEDIYVYIYPAYKALKASGLDSYRDAGRR